MSKPKVVLVIEGGVLQQVLSDAEIDYLVIDYDSEGTDKDALMEINQDGGKELAICYTSEAGGDPAVGDLFKQFNSQSA